QKVTRSTRPAARISKISAAVMVDGKYVPVLDENGQPVTENGVQKTQYVEWSQDELKNFQAIVASSLGMNLESGDVITIRSMEFAKEDLAAIEALMRERENREIIKNLIKYLVVGLA